ncbi:MAG: hypothetical protein AAF346_24755 [Pseudomonadota bacterium]
MAIRRIHRLRHDVELVTTRRIGLALKGLLRDFVHRHGTEALIPSRKEPTTIPVLRDILELPFPWSTDVTWFNFRVMLCTMMQTGFRKSEVCLPNGAVFGPDRLSRASLRWYINQELYAVLTPILAASLTVGDAAVIVPASSKADPFGLNFGPNPIYLPYDSSSPINAAVHLASNCGSM